MEEEVEELEAVGLQWDKPYYTFNGNRFIPVIYDGLPSSLPSGFNTITIKIDGRMKADLTWKKARQDALEWSEKGYFICWEMDLGLFHDLAFPIAHQAQYLSLGLSLEHFRDTLWKEFSGCSIGLIVYRGLADFSRSFGWDDIQIKNLREWLHNAFGTEKCLEIETGIAGPSLEKMDPSVLENHEQGRRLLSLFCRDVAFEYVGLLTSRLPDSLPRYMLMDVGTSTDDLWQVQLLHPELFEQVNLMIRGSRLPLQAIEWGRHTPFGYFGSEDGKEAFIEKTPVVGVCLPSIELIRPSYYRGIEKALEFFIFNNILFKIIPEAHLITNWDGLDYLVFVPAGLSSQGKRKLQGFCAAGGTGVALGDKLGLALEIDWNEFVDNF